MANALTVLGGKGFVGSEYVNQYYDAAIGNIASVNDKYDYNIYSPDVLYFISTVHNYNVYTNPVLDINTNLRTLIGVLDNWKRRNEHGVFNFISSWFVYGEQDCPHGVREDAYCNPKGFYSITKRCAEQLLVSYCDTFGLKYRILRLGNIIGPGDHKASAQKNALQFLANKLKANEPIQIYGDGHFYRDYIHKTDCARAIDLVLNKGEENSIYNIGNGKTWDFLTIISFLQQQTSSTSDIQFIEAKEFHKKVQISSFYMNVDRLKNLGFVPQYLYGELFKSLL